MCNNLKIKIKRIRVIKKYINMLRMLLKVCIKCLNKHFILYYMKNYTNVL